MQMHWIALWYYPRTQTNVNFSENIQTVLIGLALKHFPFFRLKAVFALQTKCAKWSEIIRCIVHHGVPSVSYDLYYYYILYFVS